MGAGSANGVEMVQGPVQTSSADHSPTEAAVQEATAAHRGHVAGSGPSFSGGDSQGGLARPAGGARGGEWEVAVPPLLPSTGFPIYRERSRGS